MLERAKYLAQRNRMTNDANLEETARICSFGSAAGIGLTAMGSCQLPGRRGADRSGTFAEAVALTPRWCTVIPAVRVLVRDDVLSADLPGAVWSLQENRRSARGIHT